VGGVAGGGARGARTSRPSGRPLAVPGVDVIGGGRWWQRRARRAIRL